MGVKTDSKNYLKKAKLSAKNVFKRKVPVRIPVYKGALLEGRVALITGSSSGIGFAMAEAFLSNGATVVITGRNPEKLESAREKLLKVSKNVYSVVFDIEDVDSFGKKVKEIDQILGGKKIDILVNNAGVFSSSKIESTTVEEYDKVLNTNLRGVYFLSQEMFEYFRKNKVKGNILNIASSSSMRPATNPYAVSKWGIKGLTIGMAKRMIDDGVVVNGIAPGPTATEMINKNSDSITKSQYPLDRFIMPEEIANLAVFLVSDMGRMIVGDIVYMSGGLGITTVDDLNY